MMHDCQLMGFTTLDLTKLANWWPSTILGIYFRR